MDLPVLGTMIASKKKLSRRIILRAAAVSAAQVAAMSALAQKEPFVLDSTPPLKFKILSLDGGGVRGYLSARILANIEAYLDQATKVKLPLGRRFDFLVGTSTGGIIALGLAIGRTAVEIASFYETLVPTIFNKNARRGVGARTYSPKYESTALRKALEGLFKDATLENVQTDVCITGVALRTGKPRFYKSLYQAANIGRQKEKLVDIALATSAAPTYFAAHDLKFSERIIDGGICANNPSVVAIVDAINFERPSLVSNAIARALADIVMISVGTGEQPSMPYNADDLAAAGWLRWAQHISDVMFESQSVVADTQARFLLPNNYLRINPKLGSAMLLDDADHLDEFKNISDIDRSHESFIKKFFI